ncbi:MAG: endonuclease/exonuclease/phosphatase family protein [Acidimicrobiia bacterium]
MILILIPAVVLAFASLAAFFGRYVWWLDVIANFRVQFLVALLALGAVLALSRFRRWAAGILFVAGINLAVVAPLYLGSPGDSSVDAPSVRVMSFNLLSTNDRYGEVAEYIRETEPDVVVLHEASLPWETAMESSDLGYEVTKSRSDDLIFGTLVMTRSSAGVLTYGFRESDPRAVEITTIVDGWDIPVTILSSHPLAPTDVDRAALRDAQLAFAAEWAADQSGPYMVVGDFNATPWSWPFRNLLVTGRLRNSQIGFGVQPSFAATSNPLFRVPIDHLVHSDALVVRQRRLGPTLGSDHFPLIVDLELVDG